MILVKALRKDGDLVGFISTGHADFADHGQDIVCSAVTAQLMMTVNGLTEVLKASVDITTQEEGGHLVFVLKNYSKEQLSKAQLLLRSLELGLEAIRMQYPDHITLKTEEV